MPLTLSHVSKQFGTVLALDDVTFDVRAGEVHALLGENGAGKTTLMRIAYGMIAPDAGTVAVEGVGGTRSISSPAAARSAGIGMVHQHFTSIPALSVGENIALSAGWQESGRGAEHRAAQLIARIGIPIQSDRLVKGLSAQMRQRLELAMALAADAHILLLDEPSAVLAPREVQEFLQLVRAFVGRGGAAVLISHKLNEVFAVADRVTVLRRGAVVLEGTVAGETPQSLSRAMIGGDLVATAPAPRVVGEVVVRATKLTLSSHGRTAVREASFDVRAGEIVGVAAIEGNGQRELLRAIAGVDEIEQVAGALEVNGRVAFIPEDRTTEGVIPSFTLTENVMLGMVDEGQVWIDWDAMESRTAGLMAEFDVRAPDAGTMMGTLSGGNQQKLVFARALAREPGVLVAEDPTRGLDIQATQSVHERLRAAARSGIAVVVHSSDLDEVLALSNRVLVIANGRVMESDAGASRESIGDDMLGLKAPA